MSSANRTLDPGAPINPQLHLSTGEIPPLITNILLWDHPHASNPSISTQWPPGGVGKRLDFIIPTLKRRIITLVNGIVSTLALPMVSKPSPSWLYILSLKEGESTFHFGVITPWPVFEALKPLLTFFLTQMINGDLISLPMIFDKLNSCHINELLFHFTSLPPLETALSFKLNSNPQLPHALQQHFQCDGDMLKCSLDFISFSFPFHLSIRSLLASKSCFYGLNLKLESHLKQAIQLLNRLNIPPQIGSDVLPYRGINGFHVLINSLLLNKNILVFTNGEPSSLVEVMSSLVWSEYDVWPYFNSTLTSYLPTKVPFFIGTNDDTVRDRLNWDVLIDLKANSIDFKQDMKTTTTTLNQVFDSGTQLFLNDHVDFDPLFWDPKWFPNQGAIEYPNIDQLGGGDLNLNLTSHKIPNISIGKPQLDTQFDKELAKLIENKHDDLTVFVLLKNYIDSLITISNSFTNLQSILILNDFKVYLKELVTIDEYDRGLKKFIQYHKLNLPMPLIFNYQANRIPLPDIQLFNYYAKLVLPNYQLMKFAKALQPPPPIMFNWDEINLILDTHYLIHLIDNSLNYNSIDWSYPKSVLLQIFKTLNILLKSSPSNKEKLIEQFFITPFATTSTIEFPDDSFISFNISDYNIGLIRKLDNSLLTTPPVNGISRFTKLILIASLYVNSRGPEDVIETKKGLRRRDLVSDEFKRFISISLNDPIVKHLIMNNMNDFIKLIINDFIDSNS